MSWWEFAQDGPPPCGTRHSIRGSEAGRFEIDALGTRQYVRSDDPISGGDNCYDVYYAT